MNLLVTGIGLILAYLSFLAYNLYTFRQAAISSLSGEAQIIGSNSVTAIIFNDDASARTTLSALSSSSDVIAASIYTPSGALFADYERSGTPALQPREIPKGSMQANWVSGRDILTGTRIIFQGKVAGTVYIQARLHGLRRQAIQYATIAGIVLLLCLLVALLVGAVFRKILAQPIVSLAQTARLVSRYRDYSLRFAPQRSYGELESLTQAFNEMLAEIQQRDEALEQARAGLELRVEERTAELQTANRELEAFSYTVAHDMRAPLQTISNVCYLIQQTDQGEAAEELAPMLKQLSTSVAAMSAMIDDLLDLSRSTSAALHLKQLDLSLVASSILEGLTVANPDRQVEIAVQKRCHVNADAGLMQIVLQNLLRNAWKFTGYRREPKIEFGCKKQDGVTVFYVRDNGAGFDQRFADRLFKPFQRLHAVSDFPGTGIGLATVQRIVRRHGGEVWAEGELDKGATFYFTVETRDQGTKGTGD
jgi:signal transduction histidine kinase/Na+-transporting methylmalonyl-CoA/oxaloacetate decarboxylase gamma subunit